MSARTALFAGTICLGQAWGQIARVPLWYCLLFAAAWFAVAAALDYRAHTRGRP